MNLHNQIMNLQVQGNKCGQYKAGHRDARHAAADLSLKYERALEDAIFELDQLSEHASDTFVRQWADQRVKQMKEILEERD